MPSPQARRDETASLRLPAGRGPSSRFGVPFEGRQETLSRRPPPRGGCRGYAPDPINESKAAFLLRSLRHNAPHPLRRDKLPPVRVPARVGALDDPHTR
jgi:hypothetical protein